jgi:hypothetical protein
MDAAGHNVTRRRAHLRVGAAATATFLLFLLLGVLHKPAAADPAPSAAPAPTATPAAPQSTPQPQFPGRRGWRGRGYGGPPGNGGGSIPLPDDGSGSDQLPLPDDDGNGGQIS